MADLSGSQRLKQRLGGAAAAAGLPDTKPPPAVATPDARARGIAHLATALLGNPRLQLTSAQATSAAQARPPTTASPIFKDAHLHDAYSNTCCFYKSPCWPCNMESSGPGHPAPQQACPQ